MSLHGVFKNSRKERNRYHRLNYIVIRKKIYIFFKNQLNRNVKVKNNKENNIPIHQF